MEKLGFTIEIKMIPIEVFRCGCLLFRRFWDGWHITGPTKELEEYAKALEEDLKSNETT